VAEGTPDELKRRVSGDVVTLQVNGARDTARELLARQPIVQDVTVSDDGALRLNVFDGAESLRVLDDASVTMHSINLSRPTLDDVFLTMTGRSLRDDSPSASGQHRPEPEPAGRGGSKE
jgi:ABC-2 type transport system ATP-binding protein